MSENINENTTDSNTPATPPADEVGTQRRKGRQPKALTATQAVLLEVEAERKAQDERWGQQDHPQGGGTNPAKAREHYEALANSWKGFNDARVQAKTLGFDGILLEEVYEALAEADPAKRRAELLQVAAVAVVAIEAIDRPAPEAAASSVAA